MLVHRAACAVRTAARTAGPILGLLSTAVRSVRGGTLGSASGLRAGEVLVLCPGLARSADHRSIPPQRRGICWAQGDPPDPSPIMGHAAPPQASVHVLSLAVHSL